MFFYYTGSMQYTHERLVNFSLVPFWCQTRHPIYPDFSGTGSTVLNPVKNRVPGSGSSSYAANKVLTKAKS